jgi:hypothetical protein
MIRQDQAALDTVPRVRHCILHSATSSCLPNHDRADPQMSDGGLGLRIVWCAGKDENFFIPKRDFCYAP